MPVAIGVVLVVAVCVGVVLAWGRFGTIGVRSSRSIERYEHGLDVLGDLARRADSPRHVRVQSSVHPGEPHVYTEAAADGSSLPQLRPAQSAASAAVPAPRLPLVAPTLPGTDEQPERAESIGRARFAAQVGPVDPPTELLPAVVVPATDFVERVPQARVAGLQPRRAGCTGARRPVAPPPPIAASVEPGVLPVFGEEPLRPSAVRDARTGSERPTTDHLAASAFPVRRHYGRRRALTGIAAAVVVAGAIVGVTKLDAKTTSPTRAAGAGAPTQHHRTGTATGTRAKHDAKTGGRTHHRSAPGSSAPASSAATTPAGAPISVTQSVVTYDAPSGPYTVVISATARCWFGVQSPGAAPNGPYRYQDTLAPGTSTSYAADGPISIRIGAPPTASVTVNGTSLQLPAGYTLPYDLILQPT